jgi:Sigma-70, region 4.
LSRLSETISADAIRRIEGMLYHYREKCARRRYLLDVVGLKSQVAAQVRRQGVPRNRQERLWCELADVEREIQAVEVMLGALTGRERQFVEARYFERQTARELEREFGVSDASLRRMRARVLIKCAKVLGLARAENGRNTNAV